MKNKYEVRGEVTAIFLRRKDGTILETLIETTDLPKAQEFPNTWYAHWKEDIQSFYVHGHILQPNKKQKTFKLHRWLLDAPGELQVDHLNHNTLDNQRRNLRLVTNTQNGQNRKGANRNNKTSGIRGVSWHAKHRKWGVTIQLNGKRKHLGYFEDVYQAEQLMIEALKTYMPYASL